METGQSSTPDNKCDTFWMQFDPDEVLECFPSLFTKNYIHEIPETITLKDPLNTQMMFNIVKTANTVTINGGWENMINIYPVLKNGGWLLLKYNGSGNFSIRVYKLNHKEFRYPTERRLFASASMKLNQLLEDFKSYPKYEPNRLSGRVYDFQFKKTLKIEDLKNGLEIPHSFCTLALNDKPSSVILDYLNVCWMLVGVQWSEAQDMDHSIGFLLNGWAEFCGFCKFRRGNTISISSYADKPYMLYVEMEN